MDLFGELGLEACFSAIRGSVQPERTRLHAIPRHQVEVEWPLSHVRFFASLTQSAGCSSEEVQLEDGADVAALWRELERRHPALASIGFKPMAAGDRSFVEWDRPLEGLSEVAFLPPVSGG